jgi:hypothetical protein
VAALVVVLVLLALAGVIAVTWKAWRPLRGFAKMKLEQDNPTLPGPEKAPAEPGFAIHTPPDPGFTIASVSHGQHTPSPKNTAYKRPTAATNGFEFVGVTENLTAICKLTGRQAANCTCARHQGKR